MSIANKNMVHVPLYRRLVDEYKDSIISRRLRCGDRIDSINEMMRIHSVSRETAKTVLNILAREGLIIQKAGKGSFVADLSPRRNLWAVVLPSFSIQYQELLHHLGQQAWAMGRQLHHFVDHNDWQEEVRLVGSLIAQRYEAVIIVPTLDESLTADFYKTLSPRETLITLIDHSMAGSAFSYVIQSYDLGVQRAVQYLLGKTDGSLVFVHNDVWTGRNMIQEVMAETFGSALREMRPRAEACMVERSDRITVSYLRDHGIGGIFCCDDVDAIRLAGRLRSEGITIPGGCCMVSYGNTELAQYFTPAITSIDPHNAEMARITAEILKRKISGENTEYSQFTVSPELVIRDT